MRCRVLGVAYIRLQEVQPHHVFSQQPTWRGSGPGEQGPQSLTHTQRPHHKDRFRRMKQLGIICWLPPTQQLTKDGSGFQT